jgi:hypothetical protein
VIDRQVPCLAEQVRRKADRVILGLHLVSSIHETSVTRNPQRDSEREDAKVARKRTINFD